MSIEVRPATLQDAAWIVEELKDFDRFFNTQKKLFDSEYTAKLVTILVTEHLTLVAEKEDGVMGFISGFVHPHVFNPNVKVLSEAFWWVKEVYRGSRAGIMLLDAFTAWGKANVNWVYLNLQAHTPIKDVSMLKCGYQFRERVFLLEVG